MHEERNDNKPGGKRGGVLAGLFVIAIGLVFLADRLGADLPEWLFTWPMILISLGIFAGIKHGFRPGGWLIMLLIGGIFLADRLYDGSVDLVPFLLPGVLILVGLMIMLRPWRNRQHPHHGGCGSFRERRRRYRKYRQDTEAVLANEDFMEAVSVFGGSQKSIFSKNFKGGDVTAIFGGNDLNLSQADFTGTVVLEVVNIFGGTTIIVPSNWQVKDEMVNVFGGTDDKRAATPPPTDEPPKILIISGISVFGGVEIKNF